MDNMKFFAFRYFLVPFKQKTLFSSEIENKNDIMRNIFKEIEKTNKITHKIPNKFNKKHTLYFTHKFSNDIYLCKFSHEKQITKHEEINDDIQSTKDIDLPFIYLIIDLQRQIILFQKNTSTFRRITTAANKFKKWTEIEIKNFDFSFKIEEITYENTFWDYVDKSTEIYNLNLHLNSPNLFEGKLKAEDLLKKLKGFFNNTETDINLENEEGKLTLKKDILKSFIKYIAGGGGKWR